MRRRETIRVEWVGPSLNNIWAGRHWKYRARVARDAHKAVIAASTKIKPFDTPVYLHFHPFVKGRAYDVSNYAVTAKAIEDGLVVAGILPDDTNKWVKRIALYAPEKNKENYILVTIAEAQDGIHTEQTDKGKGKKVHK